jgi:hypothetical protein
LHVANARGVEGDAGTFIRLVHSATVGSHIRKTLPDLGPEDAQVQLQQVVEIFPKLAGLEVVVEISLRQ